ncbi:MAG: glycosyltransferase family 9 protein [Candidatus Solibacter usitatus]|nr:glycosyltransferase family 9 protein [Candidatus Solibacter usitatus]
MSSSGTNILVVRLSAMGDVIHALPAAASLKHGFPGARLTWVIAPRWAPLLESNSFVDRVILLDRKSLTSVRRARGELREARFDLAVDFQGLIQSALVASAARPDRLVGFDSAQVRERAAALFYSRAVAVEAKHVVERNLELARAAGASSLLRVFPLPEGAEEDALPDGEFVLACPLAGWESKQWPAEYYERLAERLAREAGVPLVVNGPPSSREALAVIREARLHLSSLAGLIHATRRATAVVGIDSGPLHLAAALGKPGVAIFGPTDPERNGPYGGTLRVLRSAGAATNYKRGTRIDPSMREISPDAVFEALRPVASLA